MRKLVALIKKEMLILWRDKMALAIMFIMPMILILIMTLIQDAAIKTINEKGFPIILVDNDHDSLGASIHRGLKKSDLVHLVDSIDGKPATERSARQAIAKGKFLLGVIIPKQASQNIRRNTKSLVNETLGLASSVNYASDSVQIKLFVDPVAKRSLVQAITSNLQEFISTIKTKLMFQSFSESLKELVPTDISVPSNSYEKTQNISFQEIYASDIVGNKVPNSVQHNVPAWTIFGMFFIVVPLVESLMRENKEGSSYRLRTIPVPFYFFLWGKIATYVMLNMIQFFLMIAVGIFVLPYLGMPSLDLGNHFGAIVIMAVSTSLAATGFGIFIGTITSSAQQGSILGSLSVLLLSAIGGILVPTYIMPELMRKLSIISPLNWSLEGIYGIIFRDAGVLEVWPYFLSLIFFSIFAVLISVVVQKVKAIK